MNIDLAGKVELLLNCGVIYIFLELILQTKLVVA